MNNPTKKFKKGKGQNTKRQEKKNAGITQPIPPAGTAPS